MPPDRGEPLGGRRISLVLHTFSRGGSDRVAAYLARGFADAGASVELVVFCEGGEVETILSELVGSDIPTRYLGRSSGWRALDMIVGLPKLARRLRESRPDAVISTANNTALMTVLAVRAGGLGCPVVLKTTNPIASSRHKGIARWLRRMSYRVIFALVDVVWTLSRDESEEMREAFPSFALLFRNVINPYVTPAMLAPRAAGDRAEPGKIVLSVARLTAQKRLDRLLEAFARISDTTVRLLVLGEGEERRSLTGLAASLGIWSRMSMPGYTRDIATELHDSDLFVLTSDYEGLPAALLEAMAANCPALVTDCFPSARSLIAEAEGSAIIEDPSPAALAALIEECLRRPRPTGLSALAGRYSIEAGVRSHVDELEKILPSRSLD